MRRPGYIFGNIDSSKPGTLGSQIEDRNLFYFMSDSPIPSEIETGYIPEYVRYSPSLPYGLRARVERFNPKPLTTGNDLMLPNAPLYYSRPFVPAMDHRTFNVLMV